MADVSDVVLVDKDLEGRDVQVRKARHDDEAFVVEALTTTLEPYYDGDHVAHAQRLMRTHLRGQDTRGLLSTRQQLLVLCREGQRVGLVNLVFKRQQTCKLSPLIVSDPIQRLVGLGSLLLRAAEEVSQGEGARQLYCTVAARNEEALRFFTRHGFTECGISVDQYKAGEKEVALGKTLGPEPCPSDGNDPSTLISVMPLVEDDWPQVRELLVQLLAAGVEGVGPDWIDALLHPPPDDLPATERRPRSIFVATDRAGCRRAAAVVSPKKGEALKAMPIVARDLASFEALVLDLPSLLAGRGRKVYLHVWPEPEEVRALQDAGWNLECLLPGAYHRTITTQQWGFPLTGGGFVPNLRINPQYFDQIVAGDKTLEVRVGYEHLTKIRAGQLITLVANDHGNTKAHCRVEAVRRYTTFADLVAAEDPARIIPGEDARGVLKRLRDIYSQKKENKYKPLVFQLGDVELLSGKVVSNADQ